MASPPMRAGQQQGQHVLDLQDMDGGGADLDSTVGIQLIAKARRLSIASGPRCEVEVFAGPADSDRPLASKTPACSSNANAQPYAATLGEWREDSTPAITATGALVTVTTAPFSSMIPTCAGAGVVDGDVNVAGTSHHLRTLSLAPYTHQTRLRRARTLLPPLLTSPTRPSRADLIRRSIVLTHATFASRRLAHRLASIRLARSLAARPTPEVLVERCVLPAECLPRGAAAAPVAPALVARKRAVERERVKDGLRAWVGSVWKGEVGRREEGVRRWEERAGVGRVWRLRRFWEGVGKGEA
ncbi:predicted protein [Chaetomium globosum CBS 148.51]|uniref:Uncharacterized protein n=1 Tax=Chaetomium globosum (strain ATCC 6205 / CBS 148.51 / DSM 1962 / NBRC 6347 / NRRL 1970) TaxID=306901 RepID=Q2GRJ5_CHAGB|nr:uncharacterized protein CHGG_09409 [Chaetomium globosum CBS 148.51]EAQ85395.1 predicted protein [Chaetomium globosum CBS 148.51]